MRKPLVFTMLAALALVGAFAPAAQARVSRHHVRLAHHRFRGAYHIPRFDQAEAEAEVHAQYFYRTPYLPYWVFP